MKPLIGITSNVKDKKTVVGNANYYAVSKSNGIPVILPNIENEDDIKVIANKIDGLLLTGGGDIDPTLFGEEPHRKLGEITPERDFFELALIKEMLALNKPILGICRGSQILNIAAGGDMYQDIYAQYDHELLQHDQNAPYTHASHFIHVVENSILHTITQKTSFKVNSYHHQAVRKMGENFIVSATSSDGVIEAIESTNHKFVVGVQWHPELLMEANDQPSIDIFMAFIEACYK